MFKDEPWSVGTTIVAGILVSVSILTAVVQYMAWRDGGSDTSITAWNDAATIRLGGAFGLSGVCAEWGEGEKKAAQMAVDEVNAGGGVNGKILDFIIEDTQCENKTTVNAVQKLVNADHVMAIVGPTWGDAYQGASPIINGSETPAVSPDTALEALEFQNQPIDYIFSTYAPQRKEIAALEAYAQGAGLKDIAMVWDQDSYSTMMVRLFEEAAPAHGIAISDRNEMPTGIQDMRTIIAKLTAARREAVFISFLAPHAKASFLKQAKELGFGGAILSAADIEDESVLRSFGKAMDGVIYTYPVGNTGQEAFKKAYRAKYGEDPQGPAGVNAYDAVRIIAAAMGTGVRNGEELRDALMRTRIKGAFIDDLGFDAKHQVDGGEFELKTVRNGAFVPFK